jgi:hypothetical protein
MNIQKITQITTIENLILESRAILKNIDRIECLRSNFGIVIHPLHGEEKDNHTIVFKKRKYILIVPKGEKLRSFMYGSCEEALYASKRFLLANPTLQRELTISIDEYSS